MRRIRAVEPSASATTITCVSLNLFEKIAGVHEEAEAETQHETEHTPRTVTMERKIP